MSRKRSRSLPSRSGKRIARPSVVDRAALFRFEKLEPRQMLAAEPVSWSLLNDDGTLHGDEVTTDPRLNVVVDDYDTFDGELSVEVDFGGDGTVEIVQPGLEAGSQWLVDPRQFGVVPGQILVKSRTTLIEAGAPSTTLEWQTFSFDFLSSATPRMHVTIDGNPVESRQTTIDFGSTAAGTPVTRTLSVQNIGTADLTLPAYLILPRGFSSPADVSVSSWTLTPGQTRNIQISFDATGPGTHSGKAMLLSNDVTRPEFIFNVEGTVETAEIDILHNGESLLGPLAYLDFGNLQSGQTSLRTIEIANDGDVAVTLSSLVLPQGYSTSFPAQGLTIAPGTSSNVDVTFDATSAGAWDGQIVFSSPQLPGQQLVIIAVGEIDSPRIVLEVDGEVRQSNRDTVSMGATFVGIPVNKSVVVRNEGQAALHLETDSSVPEDISIDLSAGPWVLLPGQSVSLSLTMFANGPGVRGGMVELNSNDPNQPVFSLPVYGNVIEFEFGLYADTGSSGNDLVTSDPRIGGIVQGFVRGTATVEIDTDSDGTPDVVGVPRETGRFVIDPDIAPGAITLHARLVAYAGDGTISATGVWLQQYMFHDPEETDQSPEILSAGLSNDTGPDDDDGISWDWTIEGEVSNDGSFYDLEVLVDHDGDEEIDDIVPVGADGHFRYRAESPGIGEHEWTISIRETTYSGEAQISEPETVSFEVVAAPVPLLTELELKRDTGESDNDGITIDPTIVGHVDFEGSLEGARVEVDFDGDGWADGGALIDSSGDFEIRPSRLQPGSWTVRGRVTRPGDTQPGAWDENTTLDFELQRASAPNVSGVVVASPDYELAGETFASDPTITGNIGGEYLPDTHTVEFDHNGDGLADGSTSTNSEGEFAYTPSGLRSGPVTIRYRSVTVDPYSGDTLYGNWSSIAFNYAGTDAPVIESLFVDDIDLDQWQGPGDPETDTPVFTGTVTSPAGNVAFATVEFDLNGDNVVDETTFTDVAGEFEHQVTVTPGVYEIGIRAKSWNPVEGSESTGSWREVTVNIEANTSLDPPVGDSGLVDSTGNTVFGEFEALVDSAVNAAANAFNVVSGGPGGGGGGIGEEGGGGGPTVVNRFNLGALHFDPLAIDHNISLHELGALGFEQTSLIAPSVIGLPVHTATVASGIVSRTVNDTRAVDLTSGSLELDGSLISNSVVTVNTSQKTFSINSTFQLTFEWTDSETDRVVEGTWSATVIASGGWILVSGNAVIDTGTFTVGEQASWDAEESFVETPPANPPSGPNVGSTDPVFDWTATYGRDIGTDFTGTFSSGGYSGLVSNEDDYSISFVTSESTDYTRDNGSAAFGFPGNPATLGESWTSSRAGGFNEEGSYSVSGTALTADLDTIAGDTRSWISTVVDSGPIATANGSGEFESSYTETYVGQRTEIGDVQYSPSAVLANAMSFNLGETTSHVYDHSFVGGYEDSSPDRDVIADLSSSLSYDGSLIYGENGSYNIGTSGLQWTSGQFNLTGDAEHDRSYSVEGTFEEHTGDQFEGSFDRSFAESSETTRTNSGSFAVTSALVSTYTGSVDIEGSADSTLELSVSGSNGGEYSNFAVSATRDAVYSDSLDYVQTGNSVAGDGEYSFEFQSLVSTTSDSSTDFVEERVDGSTASGTVVVDAQSENGVVFEDSGIYELAAGQETGRSGDFTRTTTETTDTTIESDILVRSAWDSMNEGLQTASVILAGSQTQSVFDGQHETGEPTTGTFTIELDETGHETSSTTGSTRDRNSHTTMTLPAGSESDSVKSVDEEGTFTVAGREMTMTGTVEQSSETTNELFSVTSTEYWVPEQPGPLELISTEGLASEGTLLASELQTSQVSETLSGNFTRTSAGQATSGTFTRDETRYGLSTYDDEGTYPAIPDSTFSKFNGTLFDEISHEEGSVATDAEGNQESTGTWNRMLTTITSGDYEESLPDVDPPPGYSGVLVSTGEHTSHTTLEYTNGTFDRDPSGTTSTAAFDRVATAEFSDDSTYTASWTVTVEENGVVPPGTNVGLDGALRNSRMQNNETRVSGLDVETAYHDWGTETVVTGDRSVVSRGETLLSAMVREGNFTDESTTVTDSTDTYSVTMWQSLPGVPLPVTPFLTLELPSGQVDTLTDIRSTRTTSTTSASGSVTEQSLLDESRTWKNGNQNTTVITDRDDRIDTTTESSVWTMGPDSLGHSESTASSYVELSDWHYYTESSPMVVVPQGEELPEISGTMFEIMVTASWSGTDGSVFSKFTVQGNEANEMRTGNYISSGTEQSKGFAGQLAVYSGDFTRDNEVVSRDGTFFATHWNNNSYTASSHARAGDNLSLDLDQQELIDSFPDIDDAPPAPGTRPPVTSANGTKWSASEQTKDKGCSFSLEARLAGTFESRQPMSGNPLMVANLPENGPGESSPFYDNESSGVVRYQSAKDLWKRQTTFDEYSNTSLAIPTGNGGSAPVVFPVDDSYRDGPNIYQGLMLPNDGKYAAGLPHNSIVPSVGDRHEYGNSTDRQRTKLTFFEIGAVTTSGGDVSDESTWFYQVKTDIGRSKALTYEDRVADEDACNTWYCVTVDGDLEHDIVERVTSSQRDKTVGDYTVTTDGQGVVNSHVDAEISRLTRTSVKGVRTKWADSETQVDFFSGEKAFGSGWLDRTENWDSLYTTAETGNTSYSGGREATNVLGRGTGHQLATPDDPPAETEVIDVTIDYSRNLENVVYSGGYFGMSGSVGSRFEWDYGPSSRGPEDAPITSPGEATDQAGDIQPSGSFNNFEAYRFHNEASVEKGIQEATANRNETYDEASLQLDQFYYFENGQFGFTSPQWAIDPGLPIIATDPNGPPPMGTWVFEFEPQAGVWVKDFGEIENGDVVSGERHTQRWSIAEGYVDHTNNMHDWEGGGIFMLPLHHVTYPEVESEPESRLGYLFWKLITYPQFMTGGEFIDLAVEIYEESVDSVQGALDVAGLLPGIGFGADLLNAGISAARQNYVAAGISLAAALPLAGDLLGLGKIGGRAFGDAFTAGKSVTTLGKAGNAVDAAASLRSVARQGDNAAGAVVRNIDKLADSRRSLDNIAGRSGPEGAIGRGKLSDELGTKIGDPPRYTLQCRSPKGDPIGCFIAGTPVLMVVPSSALAGTSLAALGFTDELGISPSPLARVDLALAIRDEPVWSAALAASGVALIWLGARRASDKRGERRHQERTRSNRSTLRQRDVDRLLEEADTLDTMVPGRTDSEIDRNMNVFQNEMQRQQALDAHFSFGVEEAASTGMSSCSITSTKESCSLSTGATEARSLSCSLSTGFAGERVRVKGSSSDASVSIDLAQASFLPNAGRKLVVACGLVLLMCGLYGLFTNGLNGVPNGPERFADKRLPVVNAASAEATEEIAGGFKLQPVAIEEIRLGQRSAGENPSRWQVSDEPEPTTQTHREVRFEMTKPSGGRLWMSFILSMEQISAFGAAPGKSIHFDLGELGVSAQATCTYIGPCPDIQNGSGNLVTGLFEHETDPGSKIFTIALADGTQIEGVTGNHPIWSVTDGEFVAAEHLRAGTILLTRAGPVAIDAIALRPVGDDERVYNLQIHGQHVYQVTAAGVLVHNNNCIGAPRGAGGLFNSFDNFARGRDFFDDLGRFDSVQAQKAWEVYQRAGTSKGLLIGGRNDVANALGDGWDKLGTLNWSPEINRAWLDGAIDAGLPIRLVTPANVLDKLDWTRWEIGHLLSRGYELRGGVFVPK